MTYGGELSSRVSLVTPVDYYCTGGPPGTGGVTNGSQHCDINTAASIQYQHNPTYAQIYHPMASGGLDANLVGDRWTSATVQDMQDMQGYYGHYVTTEDGILTPANAQSIQLMQQDMTHEMTGAAALTTAMAMAAVAQSAATQPAPNNTASKDTAMSELGSGTTAPGYMAQRRSPVADGCSETETAHESPPSVPLKPSSDAHQTQLQSMMT